MCKETNFRSSEIENWNEKDKWCKYLCGCVETVVIGNAKNQEAESNVWRIGVQQETRCDVKHVASHCAVHVYLLRTLYFVIADCVTWRSAFTLYSLFLSRILTYARTHAHIHTEPSMKPRVSCSSSKEFLNIFCASKFSILCSADVLCLLICFV